VVGRPLLLTATFVAIGITHTLECGTFVWFSIQSNIQIREAAQAMYRALSVVVLILTVTCFSELGGLSLMNLVDPLTLLFIVGIVFGGLVFSFGPALAFRVFVPLGLQQITEGQSRRELYLRALHRASQLSYAAAGLGFLIGAIAVLGNMSDPSMLGAGFAVALICPFYSVMLSVFLFDGIRAAIENPSIGSSKAQLSA